MGSRSLEFKNFYGKFCATRAIFIMRNFLRFDGELLDCYFLIKKYTGFSLERVVKSWNGDEIHGVQLIVQENLV